LIRVSGRPLALPVCAFGLAWVAGCLAADEAKDSQTANPADISVQQYVTPPAGYDERPALYGGDPRSWPTPAGNAADSNYCDAALKLPLSRTPAWEFDYTPMQFSARDPVQLAHYDGLLAVISVCPQILALDVDTGRLVFNRDVYEHLNEDSPESLTGLFFNPKGLALGEDNIGRHYCWDMLDGEPRRLWLGPETGGIGGYVALADKLITSFDGEVLGFDVLNGQELWHYPKMGRRCGVVVSADGIAVAWSSSDIASTCEFYALDTTSGAPLWSFVGGEIGWRGGVWAVIDNSQGCVYLALPDESVQRRKLETGELEWQYSWQSQTTPEEREQIFVGERFGSFPLYGVAPAVTPDGLVFCVLNGVVIALDQAGQPRWQYRTNVAVWGAIAFSNAVIVVEVFVAPGNGQDLSALRVFCPDTIDWGNYTSASAQDRRTKAFERYSVLDAATGAALDFFENAQPTAAAAPAHNLFIIGESAATGSAEHRILAYDWLDWQPAEDNTMEQLGEDE